MVIAGLLSASWAVSATVLVGDATLNGDFNASTGANISFSSTPEWTNLAGEQTETCTSDNLTYDGSQNAMLVATRLHALDTGYSIAEGDVFSISYVWRDASGWADASGQIQAKLFVTHDNTLTGTQTVLVTGWSGTSTQNNTYEPVDHANFYTADGSVAGKTLFLSIGTDDAGFARLDNVVLEANSITTQAVYLAASGSNLNDGLTPGTAWQDVDALNGVTLGPGAQILFNRGDTFTGACTLSGSGETNNPIVIGAYGTGEKPLLTGAANQAAIFLLDSANEYIRFENLKLSNFNTNNASVVERYGILVTPPNNSGAVDQLHFIDLDFADIQGYDANYATENDNHRSRAIYAETDGDDTDPTCFNDFIVDGCTFRNIDGQGVVLRDQSQDIADKKIRGTPYFPTTGFVFQNNYGTNIYRNLCMIWGPKDALIQYNTMDTTVEGSAFWPFGCEGTLVQYNLFMNIFAADADAYVCHFDYNCVDTLMQYNIGINVEGGLIEYIDPSASWSFQEGGIARYNIGIDVGWRNKENGAGMLLSGHVVGGQFYNNTIIQLNSNMTHAISFKNWGGDWPTGNEIYNNIFYAEGTNTAVYNQPLRAHPSSGLNNVIDNNLYHGNISPPQAWVTDHFEDVDLNAITNNPLFANPGGTAAADYKVLFGSPAISGGRLIAGNGGLDYFSNSVSTISQPTLGFHEYQSDEVIDSDGDTMTDFWETQYGLNAGSAADASANPDGDQLINLGEFALGGNPTNGADTGYAPTFKIVDLGGGSNRFVYVYPRRSDWQERGLTYDLGATTNLVTGPWVNWAHWVVGAEPEGYGPGFDAVTNYLSLDNAFMERFIRLEID